MSQNISDIDSNEAKMKILRYTNDVMHEELANNNIVVVATHNRADPRKFTIVADSVYDKALEGMSLTFENPDDFSKAFPEFARPPPVHLLPNMEMDNKKGIAVPIHKDPYEIRKVISLPLPANPEMDSPNNILNNDITNWAVNKTPASLLLDLGEDKELGAIWIKWNNENERQHRFTIAVATDQQFNETRAKGITMSEIPHLHEKWSTGNNIDVEPYNLTTNLDELVLARYVLIRCFGNTIDSWSTINNVKITKAIAIKSFEQDQPRTATKATETG